MEIVVFFYWEGVEVMFLNCVKEIMNVYNVK